MGTPSWAIPYIEKLKCIWMQANNEEIFRDFTDVPVKNGAYGEIFFWNNRESYSYVRIYETGGGWIPISPITLYLNSNDNGYTLSVDSLSYVLTGVVGYIYSNRPTYFKSFYPQNLDSNGIWIGNGQGQSSTVNVSQTFSTINDGIAYVTNYFTHINKIYVDGEEWTDQIISITSNGGGATHIAKRTGQLKDLSSYTSDILIVSGGGGGGLLVGETDYTGKEAGGISGSGDNSADQSAGNAFGQGESGTDVSGGGSGLYGGYKGTSSKSGGAGSGYIGNSLLSNKKMVGYNVPTSSAEGTKTESVNVYSASGESNKPKAGDGKAKIKFLKECTEKYVEDLFVSGALSNMEHGSTSQWGSPFHLNEWDNRLFAGSIGNGHTLHGASPEQNQSNLEYDANNKQFALSKNVADSALTEGWLIPLQKNQDIYKLTFDVQLVGCQGYGWDTSLIGFVSTATGSFVTKTEKNILWMNNQTGETGERVTDYNWHTFSYNLNLRNISYLGFSCANNQCKFKNIKIMCCDSD